MSDVEADKRAPLTQDRIVAAAVAYADEHGLAALSMRKLARRLGYEVMSLYNHVANKDAMIGEMLEAVTAQMPLPEPGGDWKSELRSAMIGGLRVLQAHPWAVPIWNSRLPGEARMAHLEAVMATLLAAGLSEERADHGFHALGTHLQGYALQEQAFEVPGEEDLDQAMGRFKAWLDRERYPAMLAHVEWHEQHPEQAQEFEFVLDLILSGLER